MSASFCEKRRCIECGRPVPLAETFVEPYVPRRGEVDRYWCIDCGGEHEHLVYCTACFAAGHGEEAA